MERIRCDRTATWRGLQNLFATGGQTLDLRRAFADDAGRFDAFSQCAPHVFADLSKNLMDRPTQQLLFTLARQCGLEQHRDAMFAGTAINNTEQRAVLHWLLRSPAAGADGPDTLADERAQVHGVLSAMLAYAQSVRADDAITDIVNIGIGGSDLGPQMAVLALDAFVLPGKRFHFVSNVDGHELSAVLQRLRPESTLFLIASKTFTTIETMTNAGSARDWFLREGGSDVGRHFAALTTNVAAAKAFGIRSTFGFWDWVGGRYSVWSAIGLPLAIAIGEQGFREFLAGAHDMDEHFRSAPAKKNLPMLMALVGLWNREFMGFGTVAVLPYCQYLSRFSAYLQQLEMESNGKQVQLDGTPVRWETSPVIWGEPGTNGQHAFYQMIHQGTSPVPCDFIAFARPLHDVDVHHDILIANLLAQGEALAFGKTPQEVRAEGTPSWLVPHRTFPGNRPSNTLLCEQLSPRMLGRLIALYEHKVFVQGSIWRVNSFDQWGVELGKVLAKNIIPELSGSAKKPNHDSSTQGLISRYRALRGRAK